MESELKAQVVTIPIKWEGEVVENMGAEALAILDLSPGMRLVRGEGLAITTPENPNPVSNN